MKRKCSLEEKLEAIALVEQGMSARSVSEKLHLGHHVLFEWLAAYKYRGIQGLIPKGKRKRKFSYEEKCKIVCEYQKSELTLFQLSAIYDVPSSLIGYWVRLAEKDGFEALIPKKPGRPKTGMARMKRLPKEEYEKENERLRKENERLRLENLLLKKVRALVEEITLELRNDGHLINHKTVKKLMDELGLKSEVRKVKYRSYKGEVGKTAPNIIDRDFTADRPYQKLATDVTQVTIDGRKAYLSPILDMCDGEVLSYVITDTPNLEMVITMLNRMYESVDLPEGVVLHSDQGWHYQHAAYQNSLKKHGIIQSMSRKGNCLDNAMMENFFGIMKSELLYPGKYTSMEVFIKDLIEYIEYYNNERIKLRLKGMSPVQYRNQFLISNSV